MICSPSGAFLKLVQLCWYDESRHKYLFPRGLPVGTPDNSGSWPTTVLQWDFLPEANFHRLMVYLHQRNQVVKQEGSWKHWRYAMLIRHPACEQTQAAVVASPEDGRVEVRFRETGTPELWPELLLSVTDFLENTVHQGRLKERPKVPMLRNREIEPISEIATSPATTSSRGRPKLSEDEVRELKRANDAWKTGRYKTYDDCDLQVGIANGTTKRAVDYFRKKPKQ